MNSPTTAALAFCAGIIVGLYVRLPQQGVDVEGPTEGSYNIVSAALDEEGCVLLGADGEVRPWPREWPDDLDSTFFAERGWKAVNFGTDEQPKEGWLAPV